MSSSSSQQKQQQQQKGRKNVTQQQAPMLVKDVPASIHIIPDVKEDDFNKFVRGLYTTTDVTNEDILRFVDMFAYRGFNRGEVLKQMSLIVDKKILIELVVVTALRGPQQAQQIKLSNGRTPIEMGIPGSGRQGTKDLTLNKIQAATADLAAFYLKKMDVPKRIQGDLPGWLQFPSAGSIKLPQNLRTLHVEFSKKFSEIIGGSFNDQIYSQMQANAYLDESLKLFE